MNQKMFQCVCTNNDRVRQALTIQLLVCLAFVFCAGCQSDEMKTDKVRNDGNDASANVDADSDQSINGKTIVSEGPITVENGKVTFGRREVTEEVEKEIFLSLNQRLKMAQAIEKNKPNGTLASQNLRSEHDLLRKSFMMRYDLSSSQIDAIMNKGRENRWE